MSDARRDHRELFTQAPDAMAVIDPDTAVHCDVNERYCELHGYARSDLLEMGVETLTAADWPAVTTFHERIEQAATGETGTFEWRNQDSDGRAFPVDVGVSRLQLDDETRHLVRVIERSEREERRAELERKTRAMEEAPVGITISDPALEDNPLVYANAGFEWQTGYSKSEALGRNCRFLQGDETDPEAVAQVREAIEAEKSTTVDLRNYRNDGTEFWNRLTVAPVRDDAGEVVNYVGFQQDVTERKEQERELQRYERLVSHLPVGVFRTTPGPDGGFVAANPALVSMFGADSKADLFDHSVSDLYEASTDRQAFSEQLRDEGEVVQQEIRLQRFDGESFWGAITAVRVEVDGDTYFDGIVQDITRRKEYQQRIEEQRDNLELLNEVVRHDIRNDLQLIVTSGELLAEFVAADGEELLETIIESADSAVELTKTARDIAETMLQTDADPKPVRLRKRLEAQVEDIQSTYEDAAVHLEEPVPDGSVLADEMLDSVFRNLLKNAVQHNDTETPDVTVSVTDHDERVVVHVEDNGPGVPDDRKEEIFGKGEKGLESQGTGIGLYLVHTLVEQYGGRVWVEDRAEQSSAGSRPQADDAEPRGARFSIELEKASTSQI